MTDVCTIPPAGWQCSRASGHEGPCAACPMTTESRDALVEQLLVLAGVIIDTTHDDAPMNKMARAALAATEEAK